MLRGDTGRVAGAGNLEAQMMILLAVLWVLWATLFDEDQKAQRRNLLGPRPNGEKSDAKEG